MLLDNSKWNLTRTKLRMSFIYAHMYVHTYACKCPVELMTMKQVWLLCGGVEGLNIFGSGRLFKAFSQSGLWQRTEGCAPSRNMIHANFTFKH